MRLIPSVLILALLASAAVAKPPLREVREIDDQLMMIAIADEIRKTCSDIDARFLRGIAELNGLKSKAKSLGYSSEEIDEYATSKSEKARMRTKAETWLASQGVNVSDKAELCSFGKAQMAGGTYIGSLLR